MKKTLIASAIAAATLSTSALAMDPASDLAEMLESMPDVYGNIQLAYKNVDDGDETTNDFADNGSTIGFKHDHAISEGVTGFFKAEFHFDADDKDSANQGLGEKLDEAYIGVKGDFGMVQAGTDDTVYEWVDMVDTAEAVGLSGNIASVEEGDNLQYVSPEVADGLVFGATVAADNKSQHAGALAAKYSTDNLEVVLGYALAHSERGEDSIGIAGTYSMDNIALIAQYETEDEDKDYIGLQGMYTMGQNVFALGYGMSSFDASGTEDQSDIYFQALHNVSDNMYVYLEYLASTDVGGVEDAENDTLAVGATYAF